jgi:hypothetical protein
VAIHHNTGSCRIVAAVFGCCVKGGADHFTGSAAIAQVGIYFYGFDDFLFFLSHGYNLSYKQITNFKSQTNHKSLFILHPSLYIPLFSKSSDT